MPSSCDLLIWVAAPVSGIRSTPDVRDGLSLGEGCKHHAISETFDRKQSAHQSKEEFPLQLSFLLFILNSSRETLSLPHWTFSLVMLPSGSSELPPTPWQEAKLNTEPPESRKAQ